MVEIRPINNIYSQIISDDEEEFRKIYEYFRIVDHSLKHTPRVKSGLSDGKVNFINLRGEFFWGLKNKIINFMKSSNIKFVDNTNDVFEKIPDDEWELFLKKLDLPWEPYEHQIKGARLLIESKRHIAVSATGSGKSMIIWIVMRWLIFKMKRTLLIVPDVGLVNQMYSDLYEYFDTTSKNLLTKLNEAYDPMVRSLIETDLRKIDKNRADLHFDTVFDNVMCKIYAGRDKYTDHISKITTWQSIYDLGPSGFFEGIEALIFDEVHKVKSSSYVDINKYCDANIKLGLSGTLPPELVDQLVLEGTIGQATRIVSPKKLIELGLATETVIQPIFLQYSQETVKKVKSMKWNEESKFIKEHEVRNAFLRRFMLKLAQKGGNSIILFKNKDIQNDFYKELKKVHENVFIINGDINPDEREKIRKNLDNLNDAIIIGTVSVLSTGINIKSLKNIVLGQVNKAEIQIIQTLGRVMRLHDSKDKAFLFDIVDDIRHFSRTGREYPNYMYKHFKERLGSYLKYEFPVMKPMKIQLEEKLI